MVLAAALAAIGLAVPSSGAADNAFEASAAVDLVHLNAVNIPGTIQIAEASVSPARAAANSAGLADPAGKNSYARAANVDVDVLSGTLPLTGLILEAKQSAPPDNPTADNQELLGLPLDPLLNATVVKEHASARWTFPGSCPAPNVPIATAMSEVADLKVLTTIGEPVGDALVSVDNAQGATVYTKTTISLATITGQTTRAVVSEALTQLTSVTLFKGSANEININVLAPPVVTAVATGFPGGAKVTYSEPILQVVQGGTVLGELNAATANQELDLSPLVILRLGTLTKTEAADGTSASGSANLLEVILGTTPLPIDPIARVAIAAGTVSAKVPVGGVVCASDENPLRETHKDLSAIAVQAGQTFNYAVVVPNRGACTLTSVKVVDTITGPAGSTIVATSPAASSVNGLTATWNDIGPLAPNETKTLLITVKVPDSASVGSRYTNHVDVSAVCESKTWDKGADITGPSVMARPSEGCALSGSNKAASHLEVKQGETFNYYIHVFNSGGQSCDNVTVTDTLTTAVSFVSCTGGCTHSGQSVTWNLGNLAAGESRDVVVTVKVSDSATVGARLPDSAEIKATNGSATVYTNGPLVTANSILAPPSPAVLGMRLPRTGAAPAAALMGLALLGAGAVLRRRLT